MKALPTLAVDVVCILVFAIVGRSSHAEATDLVGTAQTAWPFLAGLAAGTVVGRTWRRPTALRSGVAAWAGALVGGMVLRVVSGATVQLSFVVVAAIVLAVFLVGWRALYRVVQRRRTRRTGHAAA